MSTACQKFCDIHSLPIVQSATHLIHIHFIQSLCTIHMYRQEVERVAVGVSKLEVSTRVRVLHNPKKPIRGYGELLCGYAESKT